jgi:hypothetical protein
MREKLNRHAAPVRQTLVLFSLLISLPLLSRAQTVEARVSVASLSPPRVRVEGKLAAAATAWSFRNAYAGLLGLGERVEKLTLADARGADVPARRLAPGEYTAERPAVAFSYEVKLDPPAAAADAAHVSWLNESRGVLMPGDLLPLPVGHAKLSLALPAGWGAAAESDDTAGTFELAEAESSIILIGSDVRVRGSAVQGMRVKLAVSGDWAFAEQEALDLIGEILKEHVKAVGSVPTKSALVLVAPPPRPLSVSQWSAETRGVTVLFLSGRAPSKVSALARLTVPLTHELFHLWVPNALHLSGEYDWFYEGFTNYLALRASVRLGHFNFNDYLDTLARSRDAYRRVAGGDNFSLLDASARRWSGAGAVVYHRGMIVAALYDLAVRRASGGKRSLEDVYRELFRATRPAYAGREANATVIEAMDRVAGGADFTRRFIKSAEPFDLAAELRQYGLETTDAGGRTRIVVAAQLSSSQRDLLRQIGYNARPGR